MVAAIDPSTEQTRYTLKQVFALLEEYHSLTDRLHDERDDDVPHAKGNRPTHDGMPPRLDDKIAIDSALAWLRGIRNDPQAADAVTGFYIEGETIQQLARWQGIEETEASMVIHRGVVKMRRHMNGEFRRT